MTLQKFGNVEHRILIEKLRDLKFSCSALRLICDYLNGRRQTVKDPVTGDISSEIIITRGVPQSSVLGSLLFILYLNDFSHLQLNCNCKYSFYAHDLLIYTHTEPKNLFHKLCK